MSTLEEQIKLAKPLIDKYREYTFSELSKLADDRAAITKAVKADSGIEYQVEIQFFWDDKRKRDAVHVSAVLWPSKSLKWWDQFFQRSAGGCIVHNDGTIEG